MIVFLIAFLIFCSIEILMITNWFPFVYLKGIKIYKSHITIKNIKKLSINNLDSLNIPYLKLKKLKDEKTAFYEKQTLSLLLKDKTMIKYGVINSKSDQISIFGYLPYSLILCIVMLIYSAASNLQVSLIYRILHVSVIIVISLIIIFVFCKMSYKRFKIDLEKAFSI